jgi:MoxR-like ATPase
MELLDKLLKNLIFAMNLNDEVPEHIMKEIFRHKRGMTKSKSIAYDGDALTNALQVIEPEIIETESETDYGIITEFNAEVSKKLEPQLQKALFSEIIGYSDIKKLLMKCIRSSDREPVHVILDGPPASAKSMFLMAMKQRLDRVYYADCTNMTGPGVVDYLFNNDVKFLLLDEVEKMPKSDQNVLLNVMETGILTSTKVRKTGTKEMNLSIYATTNDIDAISKPFRSRFMEFSLLQYTFEEFCEIAVKLLAKRYDLDDEISLKIADTIWNKVKSKDVRDLLQVGKLSHSVDDVDFVAETLQKYKKGGDSKE